jgi:hypothetical protein
MEQCPKARNKLRRLIHEGRSGASERANDAKRA